VRGQGYRLSLVDPERGPERGAAGSPSSGGAAGPPTSGGAVESSGPDPDAEREPEPQ
jgi:hypothetical protein